MANCENPKPETTPMNKIIMLLSALVLVSCGGKQWDTTEVETGLLEAKGLWAENGPDNYQYAWYKFCFCPERREITVNVESGQFVSAVYTGTDEAPPVNQNGYFETVESWFEYIESVINNNPDSLEITYNEQYGYPESIQIDYESQRADDEKSFYIEMFISDF